MSENKIKNRLTWRTWTQWEIEYVINNYPTEPTEEISKRICRSPESIRHKAKEMGVLKDIYSERKKTIFDHCRSNSRIYRFDQLIQSARNGGVRG